MKKDITLTSAKEALIKSTEETKDIAIKKASEAVKKENVEKKLKNIKETAKSVKSKTSKAATTTKTKAKEASKAASKATSKVANIAINPNLFLQYNGKEIDSKSILDKFYEEWKKENKLSDIKSLNIYYKTEDDTAYCLVNDETEIHIKML